MDTRILMDLSDFAWNRLLPLALAGVAIYLLIRFWRGRPADSALNRFAREDDDLPFH